MGIVELFLGKLGIAPNLKMPNNSYVMGKTAGFNMST